MALDLNRAAFFDAVRRQPFTGHLTVSQVAGMGIIVDACPAALGTEKAAYCLATVFHETARTMQPIEEFGRGQGKAYGPTGFWGRGFVQLTWRANYARATKELRARGILKAGEDLVTAPALAMRSDVAAAILFFGMIEGWFTEKTLSDFFGPGRSDPVGARRIINGTDCDKLIAGYHAQFHVALVASARIPDPAPPQKVPDPLTPMTALQPSASRPKPAPSGGLSSAVNSRPAQPGIWFRLHALLSRKAA